MNQVDIVPTLKGVLAEARATRGSLERLISAYADLLERTWGQLSPESYARARQRLEDAREALK